jgi:hypothetical protein
MQNYFEAGGTYTYHWALKVKPGFFSDDNVQKKCYKGYSHFAVLVRESTLKPWQRIC